MLSPYCSCVIQHNDNFHGKIIGLLSILYPGLFGINKSTEFVVCLIKEPSRNPTSTKCIKLMHQVNTIRTNQLALQTVWFCLQRVKVCTYSRTRLTNGTHRPGWTRRTLQTNKNKHKTMSKQQNSFDTMKRETASSDNFNLNNLMHVSLTHMLSFSSLGALLTMFSNLTLHGQTSCYSKDKLEEKL